VRTGKGMDAGAPSQSGPRFDPQDPYTLLCERCGYVIEELDREGVCPECGKPISESLPMRRSIRWIPFSNHTKTLSTGLVTLRNPRHVLTNLVPTQTNCADLRFCWLVSASVVAALGASIIQLMSEWSAGGSLLDLGTIGLVLAVFPFIIFGAWIDFEILAWIEKHILLLIAKSRGYRLTEPTARTICAYGSVGWVITSFGFLIASPGIGHLARNGESNWLVMTILAIGSLISLAGFFAVGSFAYRGLRLCGFVNHAPPTEPVDG